MEGQTVTSNPSTHAVIIDGRWTHQDEWTDAEVIRMQMMTRMGSMMQFPNPGGFRVKHERDFIYVMIEVMGDGRMDDDDMGCVALDINHSGGSAPQQQHLRFCVQMMGQGGYRAFMNQGTGNGWSGEMPSAAMLAASMGSSSTQASAHMMYEFGIPRSMLGQSPIMGAHMAAYDKGSDRWVVWPSTTDMNSPRMMGDLRLGSVPPMAQPASIPGFGVESILIGLVVSLLALKVMRHNRPN